MRSRPSLSSMVVVGGWAILSDARRGDWGLASAAVLRLKEALLKRLDLDRPEEASPWITPEMPFLMDAVRAMLPFLDGSALPRKQQAQLENLLRRRTAGRLPAASEDNESGRVGKENGSAATTAEEAEAERIDAHRG